MMQEPQAAEVEIAEAPPKQPSRVKSVLREVIETLVLTAVIFVLVNSITGRFKIFGVSMDNTFQTGQYIIVNRLAYKFGNPQRGDVIVFVPPGQPESTFTERLLGIPGETDYIKRIIGVPGDRVRIDNGQLYINDVLLNEPYIREPMSTASSDNGMEWTLTESQYFALGDNRNNSQDSRAPNVGPIDVSRIVGQVWLVYWPVSDWKLVDHYRYP
jgi:signal peptidase I